MPKLTQAEMSAKGGKSRWKGKSAKERTTEMRRVATEGWRKRRKAFTLVETMIVIVVLGLLLAMAIPAFQTVRARRQIATEVRVEAGPPRFTVFGAVGIVQPSVIRDSKTGAEYLVVKTYAGVAVIKLEAK